MKIRKILAVTKLVSVCLYGQAEEVEPSKEKDLSIGVHMRSYHDAGHFNNNNHGLYIRKDNFVVGDYYNSIKKNSFYFGYILEVKTPNVPLVDSVGIMVGIITGYNKRSHIVGNFSPMIVPSVKFLVTDDLGFRVTWIPKTDMTKANVLHLSLEKSF